MSYVCLVFIPLSLCLARWFPPDLMNGRHDHTTAVCVFLRWSGGLRVVRLPDGSYEFMAVGKACKAGFWHITGLRLKERTFSISGISLDRGSLHFWDEKGAPTFKNLNVPAQILPKLLRPASLSKRRYKRAPSHLGRERFTPGA